MARRCRTAAVKQGGSFKGRQFTADVILWAVRWYLMFPISYRDLELMLQDRGVTVDHTTIFRWIQACAAELEKRIRPQLRLSNGSWRGDETDGEVEGGGADADASGRGPRKRDPAAAAAEQRLVAGRRDVREGEGALDLPVPGGGQPRPDDRL